MAGRRVDDVADNVFAVSSRVNSTWGGNLTDMVRARRILEVVERDALIDRAGLLGDHLLGGLRGLASRHPSVTDVRGRGLMCAFTLPSRELRDLTITRLREDERVLVLGSGDTSLRFRPALTAGIDELDRAVAAIDRVLTGLTGPAR
jgi:L-lysine 6-transaminase